MSVINLDEARQRVTRKGMRPRVPAARPDHRGPRPTHPSHVRPSGAHPSLPGTVGVGKNRLKTAQGVQRRGVSPSVRNSLPARAVGVAEVYGATQQRNAQGRTRPLRLSARGVLVVRALALALMFTVTVGGAILVSRIAVQAQDVPVPSETVPVVMYLESTSDL